MILAKRKIVAALRERGQYSRADFVSRQLPEQIDTDRHGSLLATLHIDPAEFADPPPR